MRLINPEEFAFDLNIACDGYRIQEEHPDIYKWLTRKISVLLQQKFPDEFPKVTIAPSIMKSLKPRIEVKGLGVKLHVTGDFDIKDAEAGILHYYKPSLSRGRVSPIFWDLQLSSIILWLIDLKKEDERVDVMKITYEVALKKVAIWEEKRKAESEARALELSKQLDLLRQGLDDGNRSPIRLPISPELIFQLFYTEEEYLLEGTTQNNCVHSNYWPRFVKGHALVGGLRKAIEPGTPWISIELGVSSFTIIQAEYANHQRASQKDPAIVVLENYVDKNRELIKRLRDKIFEFEKSRSAISQAQNGDLRFTVRLEGRGEEA